MVRYHLNDFLPSTSHSERIRIVRIPVHLLLLLFLINHILIYKKKIIEQKIQNRTYAIE